MTTAGLEPNGIMPTIATAWARAYCLGLSEERRMRRLLEIDSDLWEHVADRQAEGIGTVATNVEILGRLLRGVPNDIAWRLQAEGFNVNINFPVERFAGLLLVLLIVPLTAGLAISGYDTSREAWQGELERFADISSTGREVTAVLHAAIGLLLIAGAAQLFAITRDRSPRLVTMAFSLLMAAGALMLINAALYRVMSSLADAYLETGDEALVTTTRSFALAVEGLAIANLLLTTSAVLSFAAAFIRSKQAASWTAFPPLVSLAFAVLAIAGTNEIQWLSFGLAWMGSATWLAGVGIWLLFGGGRGTAAPATPLQSPA